MELSIFVAKLMALFYLGMGLAVLGGQVDAQKMMKSFSDSSGLTMISGLVMIVLGGLLVQNHNFWVKDWTVLVTIIGWALLVKGFLYTAFPRSIIAFSSPFIVQSKSFGYLIVGIALVFGYFGFMA